MALSDPARTSESASRVGIVVIGRNEGMRLQNCLLKLPKERSVVYVDSGSSDDSVSFARGQACEVVELDMTRSFTAARARNAGWRNLLRVWPDTKYIQFVDGDCELDHEWINTAGQFLDSNPEAAIVCGRLRERFPHLSIYNRLCDFEWDTPVGLTDACGGIAFIRVQALQEVNGYEDELIAGEEPEMCLRIRLRGWSIWRLGDEMALHDAAMHRFGQWWKRTKRGGFASAATANLHRGRSTLFNRRRLFSALLWGLAFPLGILILVTSFGPIYLVLMLFYPAQILRIFSRIKGQSQLRLLRACFLVLGKIPEALGVLSFWFGRLTSRSHSLIEYK